MARNMGEAIVERWRQQSMDTDATTTTDGFRVGRRVKVKAKGYQVDGWTGEIVTVYDGGMSFTVRFEDHRRLPFREHDLILLPEPDAPATPEPPADDPINRPSHYTQGAIECIDAIRAALTPEEFRGFCKGNILKYTWRERHKGGDESLRKAEWYLRQSTNTPTT